MWNNHYFGVPLTSPGSWVNWPGIGGAGLATNLIGRVAPSACFHDTFRCPRGRKMVNGRLSSSLCGLAQFNGLAKDSYRSFLYHPKYKKGGRLFKFVIRDRQFPIGRTITPDAILEPRRISSGSGPGCSWAELAPASRSRRPGLAGQIPDCLIALLA